MPELAIQQLLRERGLAGLEGLAIKTRRHGIFGNLVCFKYDQRLSPMMEKAVQEARGIILDENCDWAVTSMSFRKFFNAEEPLAAEINWTTACIEEKLDGSLMALYWYDNAWQVQSSGSVARSRFRRRTFPAVVISIPGPSLSPFLPGVRISPFSIARVPVKAVRASVLPSKPMLRVSLPPMLN